MTTDRTITVASHRLRGWVERFAAAHGPLVASGLGLDLRLAAPDGGSATLRDLWSPSTDDNNATDHNLDDDLDGWLARVSEPRTVAVILVRRGAHAVGVANGGNWLAHHSDTHYVQGRTKAGGWSQQRYARRRANQAEHAFAAAADDAVRVLSVYQQEVQALLVGGDRSAVAAVLADSRLGWLAPLRTRHPLFAIPDPRFAVLIDVITRAYDVPIEIVDPPNSRSTE